MVVFYRRMPGFDYLKPGSLEEALEILNDNDGGRYRVYAGGTDLMPKIKKRSIDAPEAVIDLKGISGLDYVRYSEGEGLVIGALASVASVASSEIVREKYTALAQGAANIASTHIQNRGTIAGNICSAVPSADSAPALMVLGAEVICVSRGGERRLAIADFFVGPGQTSLKPSEVVKEIRIPAPSPDMRGVYLKLATREKMDLAIVGVAVTGALRGDRLEDVRIGLGAVAPTPIRASQAEAELDGKSLDARLMGKASKTASLESKPIDDHRASAEYRRMMVEVLVNRGLQHLAAQAG